MRGRFTHSRHVHPSLDKLLYHKSGLNLRIKSAICFLNLFVRYFNMSMPQYLTKFSIDSLQKYILFIVVATVPFAAYASSVFYSFYGIGSSFHDAGWSAYLIHDADLYIHDPPCVDNGMSWFNSHISPLFVATSALGRLLPLTRIQFYAAYIGISHALPAIAIFWLMVSGYGMTRIVPLITAAFLALFFSFDGLALAIARFPHFMMFTVGSGMLFLVALVLRHVRLASVFFLLCLSTREDGGFHLFAVLSMLLILEGRQGLAWREQKPTAVFALLGLLYSTGAVALQHAFSTREFSLLINEYLGNPFFSHITVKTAAMRLLGWIAYRSYIVVPAICALIWAIVRRNPYIILGYVAFIPWGVLHLMAAREMVGSLPSYYAFPYMFATLWPLIVIFIQQRHAGEHRAIFEPVWGFALLTATSLASSQYLHNPTHISFPAGFVSVPSLPRQAATDRALERLAGAQELGTTLVDQSILALKPEKYKAENILSGESHVNPDSILFFAGGFESTLARELATRAGLDIEYEVNGTPIRVATNHQIGGLVASAGLNLAK